VKIIILFINILLIFFSYKKTFKLSMNGGWFKKPVCVYLCVCVCVCVWVGVCVCYWGSNLVPCTY
jgi:hypothetical protein